MSASLDKRFVLLMSVILFLGIAFHMVEGKGRKRAPTDKLDLIRDFILENYPTNSEHYIYAASYTGLHQNFWDFHVTVGEKGVYEPPDLLDKNGKVIGQKTIEPEYSFSFNISASCELSAVSGYSLRIDEKLRQAMMELAEEDETNFENVRSLLIKMGAKFPVEPGEIIESKSGALMVRYPPNGEPEALKNDILKRKSLWIFFKKGELKIEKVVFFIDTTIDHNQLKWAMTVIIGKSKYFLTVDPFYGYILRIERWD